MSFFSWLMVDGIALPTSMGEAYLFVIGTTEIKKITSAMKTPVT